MGERLCEYPKPRSSSIEPPKALVKLITTLKKMAGEMIGRVIRRKRISGPAPSTRAASYTSLETPCMAP